MFKYELMTIVKQSQGEEGAKTLNNSVKELIEGAQGKLIDEVFMGKRKFAYEIKHDKDGFYNLVHFEMNSDGLEKFTEKLSRVNGLVRYLITAD
ncbi:MAG TPA: 30S ribosomal protein S6 [Candidatus Saccharimonadales bacterium]|nr:30S ribosomal protein S6 [Candidatus Saccharimonadales bacterium]